MNKNKEWFFLYIISLIFFGIFIALLNIEFIENVFLVCNTETGALNFLVSIGIGLILYIPFFIILGMINSWILNLVYIYSYKSNNYSFLSYDFFPFIYIKGNERTISFFFNIMSLNDINSIIDLEDKIASEKDVIQYIKITKKVFKNLTFTHYLLVILGVIIGLFNLKIGSLIISYNMAIISFQSIGKSNFIDNGYVYLSKNLNKDNLFQIIMNSLKSQIFEKDFIYDYLQNNIIKGEYTNNVILDEFYQTIMMDSINDDIKYLNVEIKEKIEESFKRECYLDTNGFLARYRLYRMYCIYVFKFYELSEYEILIKDMEQYYIHAKEMPMIKNMKLFNNDQLNLKIYNFKDLDLKNKFHVCNKFDIYKRKINMENIKI
ncbi:hypothetical protein [Clostridium sulfidigenes]|uniref:hypothetical protein n=1 Tax=Clostridium sulfidigenes TaxID=318464 RepID=UPI003F8C65BA